MRHAKLFLVCAMPAFANLRAPFQVDRIGSGIKSPNVTGLIVKSENLEFDCPAAYIGSLDIEKLSARFCKARVTYKIAGGRGVAEFRFVYAGRTETKWQYRGESHTSIAVNEKNLDKRVCSFCPEDMKTIQIAAQQLTLVAEDSDLTIEYDQALSYRESGHGYFSGGTFEQSFRYELWPIAEWQWAEGFHADLTLRVRARDGFLGIGYKKDKIACAVEDHQSQQNLNFAISSQNGVTIAKTRVSIEKKPQKLRCSYSPK